jgi:SAM-dependent methyltransferase
MDLARVYAYRFRHIDQRSRAEVWNVIARYLHRRLGEPRRVLDPAAGLGEFIAHSPAADRWAVDIVDHGLSVIPGITTRIAPILEAELPDDFFDAVFVSNLLEHLASPSEVGQFLCRMHRLLRVGGVICVMGPNFKYCQAEYFDCADHVLALTHVSVAEHLYGAGFDVQSITPRFLPYSFRSILPASARLTAAYLSMPILWRFLGKQFLVIGRRPASF